MKKYFFHIVLIVVVSTPLFAQMSESDVRKRLTLVHSGKLDDVRAELSALERQYPNDAGVKYIDAYTTRDGTVAVKKYQSIVDQFPQSVWADDALYRVSQYYYSVGLYKTAEQKLEELKKQYPNSIYAQREMKVDTTETVKPIQTQQPVVEQKIEKKSEQKTEQQTAKNAEPNIDMQSGTTPAVKLPSGSYIVQIGVYSVETSANQQAQTVSGAVGKQAIVFLKTSGGRQVYAVGFDGFETEHSARNYMTELKSKYNIDSFLVKR